MSTSVVRVRGLMLVFFFFFQAEDGIRDVAVTGVQTCALPISWEATGSSGTEAWAELWARTVERADQRMGGGRLSLVGAIERAAAGLDALDPQALQVKPEDRETTALDQSAADGPTTGGPEEPTEAADLRAHQAGLSAEASHPGEDR